MYQCCWPLVYSGESFYLLLIFNTRRNDSHILYKEHSSQKKIIFTGLRRTSIKVKRIFIYLFIYLAVVCVCVWDRECIRVRSCYVYVVCLKLNIWFAGSKKSLLVELNSNTVDRLPNKKEGASVCMPSLFSHE